MTPITFPQCNTALKPPAGVDESQVMVIPGYAATIQGGNCDGFPVTVTAWQPTPDDIKRISEGKPIFLSFIGTIPPHFPTTRFSFAANPGTVMATIDCPHCHQKDVKRWDGPEREEAICDECGRPYTFERPKDARQRSELEKEWQDARGKGATRCGRHTDEQPRRRCFRPEGHEGECLF